MLVLGDHPLRHGPQGLHGTNPPAVRPTAVQDAITKFKYGWWAWNGLAYVGYGSSPDRATALAAYTLLANDPANCAGAVFTKGGPIVEGPAPPDYLFTSFQRDCGTAGGGGGGGKLSPGGGAHAPWYARPLAVVKAHPLLVAGGALMAAGLTAFTVVRHRGG